MNKNLTDRQQEIEDQRQHEEELLRVQDNESELVLDRNPSSMGAQRQQITLDLEVETARYREHGERMGQAPDETALSTDHNNRPDDALSEMAREHDQYGLDI